MNCAGPPGREGATRLPERSNLLLVGDISDGILQPTDRVLDLALNLLSPSLGLEFLIANQLAGGLLDGAGCLFGRTRDAIFVHGHISLKKRLAFADCDLFYTILYYVPPVIDSDQGHFGRCLV